MPRKTNPSITSKNSHRAEAFERVAELSVEGSKGEFLDLAAKFAFRAEQPRHSRSLHEQSSADWESKAKQMLSYKDFSQAALAYCSAGEAVKAINRQRYRDMHARACECFISAADGVQSHSDKAGLYLSAVDSALAAHLSEQVIIYFRHAKEELGLTVNAEENPAMCKLLQIRMKNHRLTKAEKLEGIARKKLDRYGSG